MMHCCTTVSGHTVVIASGSPLSPSHTAMHTSPTPRLRIWREHRQPEFGALAAVAGPDAQDVPLTVDGDRRGRHLVEELENALIGVLREPDDVDGVEFGATDGVIFLRGPDCERMWGILQPFAQACPLRPAHIILHRKVEGVSVKERIDL